MHIYYVISARKHQTLMKHARNFTGVSYGGLTLKFQHKIIHRFPISCDLLLQFILFSVIFMFILNIYFSLYTPRAATNFNLYFWDLFKISSNRFY